MSSLPETMTCIEITEPGGPEQLRPTERPLPSPAKGEVLIRIAAAGVNRPDVVQRMGHYAPPEGVTDIPGLEVAGNIVGLGDGVTGWNIGDAVCALVAGGGYGEFVTAPIEQCLPVPAGFSMVQAAALPETFFTVWTNLYERANLIEGESLMVHGGTSGIGTTAIQVASKLGARVIATAGSDEKCQACLDLGAEKAINYREDDFVPAAREFGGGKGVNVVLDMVGGDYMEKNIKSLAPDGRLVNIAFMRGAKVEVNFMPVMLKRLTLTGSTLRSQSIARKATIATALKETVWPLLNAGEIKPVIFKTFPLDQAREAHALMESNSHIGKIVFDLTINA